MPDLTVETPLGVLTFDHAGGVATPSGDPPVLATWQDAVADIQYGLYGHILDPSSCFVSDLHSALVTVYGAESVAVTPDCERLIKGEIAALPPGAVT